MIENNKDDNENKKEEEILLKETIKIEQFSSKSKQKIAFFIIMIILILIILITLIVVFSLKENKEEGVKPPLIINSTSGNHTHTIIFMPGFSNTPEDFENVFTHKINFTKKNDTTIIILRSPLVEVAISDSKNYSWFNIYSIPITNYDCINLTELENSAKILEKVIDSEANILNGSYDKIIIGGHSQGACISLYQGYKSDKNIGGIFSFSGILPPLNVSQTKDKLETYFGYGDKDEMIEPNLMLESIKRIENFKGFHKYLYPNHKHYVCTNEIKDASEFIDNITNK